MEEDDMTSAAPEHSNVRFLHMSFLSTGIDLDEPLSKSISQKYKNSTTWHEESEIVKTWTHIEPKFISPSTQEIECNPRSR